MKLASLSIIGIDVQEYIFIRNERVSPKYCNFSSDKALPSCTIYPVGGSDGEEVGERDMDRILQCCPRDLLIPKAGGTHACFGN